MQQHVTASWSDEQLQAVIARAHAEAETVELDEVATRRIIDAQLRDAGWEADSRTLTYAAGEQPIQGRCRAIAEWPTAHGPADYVLFVGRQPIAVVGAKGKHKKVPSAITRAVVAMFQVFGTRPGPVRGRAPGPDFITDRSATRFPVVFSAQPSFAHTKVIPYRS